MCVCVWESGSSFNFIGTNHYKTRGLSGGLLDFLLMGWQVILSANLIERKWLGAMVHIRFHRSLHCIYLQVTCRAPRETRDGKPFRFMSVYGGWEIRACTFKPVWSTESRGPVPRKAVILPLILHHILPAAEMNEQRMKRREASVLVLSLPRNSTEISVVLVKKRNKE